MTRAEVLADSVNCEGQRLTTMQLQYHLMIHAELLVHRVFSRNSRSSRAVPVKKLIQEVRENPAMPVHWGSNKPGMQAGAELTGSALADAQEVWRKAARYAAMHAEELMNLGLHKQLANRVISPYLYIHTVLTGTEFENFFRLRRHPDAQPEIKALADAMWVAMEESTPVKRAETWHRPYITQMDKDNVHAVSNGSDDEDHTLNEVSAARCARVSYNAFDGSTNWEKDTLLAEQLIESGHGSPFEHIAYPDPGKTNHNLSGWRSFRCDIDTH